GGQRGGPRDLGRRVAWGRRSGEGEAFVQRRPRGDGGLEGGHEPAGGGENGRVAEGLLGGSGRSALERRSRGLVCDHARGGTTMSHPLRACVVIAGVVPRRTCESTGATAMQQQEVPLTPQRSRE